MHKQYNKNWKHQPKEREPTQLIFISTSLTQECQKSRTLFLNMDKYFYSKRQNYFTMPSIKLPVMKKELPLERTRSTSLGATEGSQSLSWFKCPLWFQQNAWIETKSGCSWTYELLNCNIFSINRWRDSYKELEDWW